jgi:peptide/nickel transport system ATP-binding protein
VLSDFLDNAQNINHEEKVFEPKTIETDNQSPVLSVQSLVVEFAKQKNFWGKTISTTRAVDEVSFDVFPQEIVGLVGESGCGKTTLSRTILQLIKPSAGKILINGQDTQLHPEARAKDIQIVFQDPYGSLHPRLSIGDALTEPMKVHGLSGNRHQRKEKAAHLLEQVGLSPDQMSRYPHQFSGGQRQRICIARALALEPSFIIFDESVSALDVSMQAQILNLILELRQNNRFAALFISHNLKVVYHVSDRIMVMQSGKIVESNPAEELFSQPQHPYTQTLIGLMKPTL